MTTEETVIKALEMARTEPKPLDITQLISTYQSFTPLFYHLVKIMSPQRIIEWGPGQSTHVFLLADENVKIDSLEQVRYFADLYYGQLMDKNPDWKDRLNFQVRPSDHEFINSGFQDNTFDFALVDANARHGCMFEAERIVKSGGVIACHDTQRDLFFETLHKCLSPEKTKFVGHHFPGRERTSIWVKL